MARIFKIGLGQIGAMVAAPLIKVMGLGSWGIPSDIFGMGPKVDRAYWCGAYGDAFDLCANFLGTLCPLLQQRLHLSAVGHIVFQWVALFGDTVLFMILQLLPGPVTLGANVVALVLGTLVLILGGYVTGLIFGEIKTFFRVISVLGSRLILGLIFISARGWSGLRSRQERRAAERSDLNMDPLSQSETERVASMIRAEPAMPSAPAGLTLPVQPQPKSLFARVLKRGVESEPVQSPMEPFVESLLGGAGGPMQDRIRGKIFEAIRSRDSQAAMAAQGQTPIVTAKPGRPTGPVPIILQHPAPEAPFMEDEAEAFEERHAAAPQTEYMTEPPLTASHKQVVQHGVRRAIKPSSQAIAEAQPTLDLEPKATDQTYEKPPLSLLMSPSSVERHVLSDDALQSNARMLESVLDDYGVKGEIVSVRPGPVVTMYELEPAPGLKASRVIGLSDDIARSMSALSARVSTVPGRSVIGIELPNESREMCVLREILSARDFGDANMRLPLALGKDIGGEPIVANLAKMPHLLIAGTTGSGKSVAINTMILSLLYRLTPEECRMIMIDPKMLELSVYDGIPHLLSPVVTDPKKAVVALKWTVGEMEERYRKMSKMGVRNIDGYNSRVKDAQAKGEMFSRTVQTGFDEGTGEPLFETEKFEPETLPYIVVDR